MNKDNKTFIKMDRKSAVSVPGNYGGQYARFKLAHTFQ